MIKTVITLAVIFILILCIGFFTSSETAFLSLSRLKVRSMLEEKKRNARLISRLKANMQRLLTTVLIGTNFLNALVSAVATALVQEIFGGGGVGYQTFIIAFFITTFGQIIPKTIAFFNPERTASFASVGLYLLEIIFFPVVFIFESVSSFIVWIVKKIIKPSDSIVTEEELKALIDVGEKEGTIEKGESRMLNKLIKFNDLSVNQIMKHRSFLSMVDQTADYETVKKEFLRSKFSTIPVYKDTKENIVGVINYKKLLGTIEQNHRGKNFALSVMNEVEYIPGTLSVLELLQKFRKDEYKFAVVLDEQGQAEGIATMEDVMRVVFGRMTDENNWNDLPAEEKIKLVSINTFIVPGELKLADVNEILELNLSSDEMTTIGGWLLEQFGFLPTSGTVFKKDNIIFTAEDVSMRRIVSVRIQK